MFRHHPPCVIQSSVGINRHQHQEEESMVMASSSSSAAASASAAAAAHHHMGMGFNINPPPPPPLAASSSSSSLIPNCFGAHHQLDSIFGSASHQAAAASSSSPPPPPPGHLKNGSDHDRVHQLPPSSSSTITPWAWSGDREGALLLSKKSASDPRDKKKKKKGSDHGNSEGAGDASRSMMVVVMKKKNKKKKKVMMGKAGSRKRVREPRFCFKTMSEVDVLDDGYKWRKYGQKVVKNTQHPRSYYRCTQDNCRVKKRIERLAEDPRMVITTYEGRHVHSPSHDQDPSQTSSHFNLFW